MNKKVEPYHIWMQFYEYLLTKGEQMKAEYTKRMRGKDPSEWSIAFSWKDVDDVYQKIKNDLTLLSTWKEIE